MKKFYLLLALLLTCFMGGQAQTGGKTVLLYGLRDYSVFALSPNGQWATGAFTNGLGSYYAFSWNLVTGDCVLLSGGNNQSVGYGVSNDGTVVGTYSSSEVSENGAVVECAAYCTPDGTWHILGGADGGYAVGGQALCVSGNGEYIGGAMTISGRWSPVVWKNGEFHKNLCIMEGGSLQQGAVFSISGDGSVAGGWTYTSTSGGERESVYWDVENWNEETADAYTMLTFDGNPFYTVRGVSPDGNYLVYMSAGGVTYVRNIETGEDTRVPGLEGVEMWELNYNAINDQRMAVGSESIGNGGSYIRAVVTYVDENGDMVTRPIDDYVREQDPEVDFASVGIAENPGIEGAYQLLEGRGVSNDGNVFAVVTADTGSSERPLVILMNRGGVQAPVAVEAEQLDGLYATKLTWYAPLGSEDEITGYNIYRNGEKVNAAVVTELSYIDANLSEGSYNYSVTALYGDMESEASSEVAIALTPKPVSVPNAVYLRQKGLNSAALSWTTPSTNRVEKNYLDPNVAIDAFGGGNRSFEGGIKFDHNEIAVYEGYTLTAVAFYPMSEQQRWTLNIYDGTELVYTQPIEQSLAYGEENIVTLNEPFDLSTLENDIICAISVTVPSGVETYNVLGVNLDKQVIPGYSDLMRSSTEAAEGTFLYSMYDYSVGNGTSTRVSWGISMIFSAPDEAADIDELSQYNIFMNGEQVGQTENLTYVESGLEDGTYTFGVQAQYADGRTSEIVSSDIAIEENTDAYKPISSFSTEVGADNVVNFSWPAPLDDDAQLLTYGDGNFAQTVAGTEDNGYGYWVRVRLSGDKLKGLNEYLINSFSFYPTADCEFTFMLRVNDREVINQYIESYTLNTWNTVKVHTPVYINENYTYDVIIDCFDNAQPTVGPMGLDDQPCLNEISNAYSTDEGVTWGTIQGNGTGNWMLGINVADPNGEILPVDGYEVRIDSEQANESTLTEPEFSYDFGADADRTEQHRLNIDARYTGFGRVAGDTQFFTINSAVGIDEGKVIDINVNPNPASSYVRVEGGNVEEIAAYSTNGMLMGKTRENLLDVSSYAAGLYILQIKVDGQVKTVKLNVIK